ncbi:alpha/beta fold hydrolase [Thalassotalea sp. PS06]|uniref:alpha/beta fold hydrolase n=1 Tax=Thalassotalea sp. PS06 TaxID=2594005 RepID=UPI001163D386|nr:alpha/beta fold hydrolase [Thalassotalea sp. PS06]QDP00002.1 alpha/beta fold hydrolase [Thalassotalea sp. PS06]
MTKFSISTLLILSLFSGAVAAMPSPYSFSQEQQLTSNISGAIAERFARGTQAVISRDSEPDIHYYLQIENPENPCVVISPGRAEGYLKYQEVVFDLTNNGFNVAIVDHRGQGLSEREQEERHRGYVQSFDHYVEDLQLVLEQAIAPNCQGPLFLLGHSMGGTIASLYGQKYPERFQAIALSAPMFGIDTGGIPDWLATTMVGLGSGLNSVFSDKAWYFFGHGPYQQKPFAENELMHSEIRYQIFKDTWQQHPKAQLGGVTFAWLNAAIDAMDNALNNISQFKAPVLILQAEQDTVVDNQAQQVFCEKLAALNKTSCVQDGPVVIKGARHEILFESDDMRQEGLSTILDFFNDYLSTEIQQDLDE